MQTTASAFWWPSRGNTYVFMEEATSQVGRPWEAGCPNRPLSKTSRCWSKCRSPGRSRLIDLWRRLGSGDALSPPLSSLISIYIKYVLFARSCAGNRNVCKAWPMPPQGAQTCEQSVLGVGDTGQGQHSILSRGTAGLRAGSDPAGVLKVYLRRPLL